MKFSALLVTTATVAASSALGAGLHAKRAVSLWAQCGGINYSGSTECTSGSTCVHINDYYFQCQPGSQATSATNVKTTTAASTSKVAVTATKSTAVVVTSTKATVTTSTKVSSPSAIPGYSPVTNIYPLHASKNAIATTYGGNWPGGTCSFSDYPHVGINGVALGKEQWFGAAGCGSCIKITGASGSVTAMVNDQCPECTNNHLDLDSSYAGQVDKDYQTKGIFDISWEFVPCPVSGKIQFKNKEGTSAYYFALQVRNSVLPIDKLEVSTNGGTSWTKVDRSEYNFFTAYGGFGDLVDVRLTASTGAQIVEKNIKVSSGSIVNGSQQFSA